MSILSKLSEEQRKRFPFIGETVIMYNGNYRMEVVHFITKDIFTKLEKLFTTSVDISNIKPKMKAYIIGNGTLKMSDIKEVCKKKELKITTDISNADIIISNSNLVAKDVAGTGWFVNRAILHSVRSAIYDLDSMNGKYKEDLKRWFIGRMPEESISNFDDYDKCIMPKNQSGYQDFTYEERDTASVFITDEGLELLYHILSKKIPIVLDTSLFESIEKVTIDSDMYDMIKMMIRSTDDDKIIAMQMLYNCNINKSGYYLWKLLKEDGHRIMYSKNRNTKIHKTFVESISDINHIGNNEAIDRFYELGCLTEDIYDEFVEKGKKEIMTELRYMPPNIFSVNIESLTYENYLKMKEAVYA